MHAAARLAFALPVTLAALAPDAAEACSAPVCWPGAMVPADGAIVPANVPGFLWRPMGDYQDPSSDPTHVTLVDTAAPTVTIPLTSTPAAGGLFVLAPAQPLVAGKTYKLTDTTECSSYPTDPLETTFTTSAAVPLPTSLGTTSATATGIGPVSVATTNGSCSAQVQADRADIGVALSADAMPWRDLLVYTTSLDGAPWSAQGAINVQHAPGESWTGRGTDRIYRVCETEPEIGAGAAAGAHSVALRATLPNTTLDLAATPASFTLSCGPDPTDPDPAGDDAGGCSAGAGAGACWIGVALAISLRRQRRA